MKFRLIILMVLALGAQACNAWIDESVDDSSCAGKTLVPADFSFSVYGSGGETKADVGTITELLSTAEQPIYRGISNIRLLFFSTGTRKLVEANSVSMGAPSRLSDITGAVDEEAYDGEHYHQGLMAGNHSHLYSSSEVSLPLGATSALVYATVPPVAVRSAKKAVSSVEQKHLNGSLVEQGFSSVTGSVYAGNIGFVPDPIDGSGSAVVALDGICSIMNYLTEGVSYSTSFYYDTPSSTGNASNVAIPWNASLPEGTLRDWFLDFSGRGKVLVAAGANLEWRLSALHKRLLGYSPTATDANAQYRYGDYPAWKDAACTIPLTNADLYNGLRDVVLGRFQNLENPIDVNQKLQFDEQDNVSFYSETFHNFPADFGLPNGSVRINWNGSRFVVSSSGLDGNIPLAKYCYMPPLYYFVNTNLSTSMSQAIYKNYTLETWDQILSNYRLGKIITEGTRAVALDQPLQYACGTLAVTVQATTSQLRDGNGQTITPLGESFRVTGIVMGSQYQQSFDFTPRTDNVQEMENLTEYFLYDNKVSDMFMTSTAESQRLITLSLPTPKESNVHFFLELQNNSGHAFQGKDGVVQEGFKFYLAGVLDWEGKMEEEGVDRSKNRVIMQDCCTVARCRVSTLENAYLVLPSVGNPKLEMGVQTQMNWYHSSGTYVVLD